MLSKGIYSIDLLERDEIVLMQDINQERLLFWNPILRIDLDNTISLVVYERFHPLTTQMGHTIRIN